MPSTLFVAGFGSRIRAADLAYEFERYGRLIRCDIPAPKSFSSKPYAFVEYEDPRDAEDAFNEMHGRRIDAYTISVQWARNAPSASWRYDRSPRRRPPYDYPSRTSLTSPPPLPLPISQPSSSSQENAAISSSYRDHVNDKDDKDNFKYAHSHHLQPDDGYASSPPPLPPLPPHGYHHRTPSVYHPYPNERPSFPAPSYMRRRSRSPPPYYVSRRPPPPLPVPTHYPHRHPYASDRRPHSPPPPRHRYYSRSPPPLAPPDPYPYSYRHHSHRRRSLSPSPKRDGGSKGLDNASSSSSSPSRSNHQRHHLNSFHDQQQDRYHRRHPSDQSSLSESSPLYQRRPLSPIEVSSSIDVLDTATRSSSPLRDDRRSSSPLQVEY